MKLTKTQIDTTTPGMKDIYLWDTSPRGFGVRVRPSGAKTFIYSYRVNGGRSASKVKFTIGRYPSLTVEQARKEGQRLAGHVAAGGNPAKDRDARRREQERQKDSTAVVAEEFIERYAKPKIRSWREYERILNYYVKRSELGRQPVHEVSRRELVKLLDRISDENGHVMADHVLAVLRKMFNWHAARDDDFRSPIVIGMARTSPRDLARDRVLNDDEIRAIWNAVDLQNYPFAPLVRMLFVTAARRQEVAEAQWSEIDGATWTIPKERYKTKHALVIPLSQPATSTIKSLPQNGPHLFTTTGSSPFSGFSKAKKRLDDDSGVHGWRLHDIRRTARTLMVRAGVRPDIAERVLGHVIPGVAGVYDRYDYVVEKRQALDALANELQKLLSNTSRACLKLVVNH